MDGIKSAHIQWGRHLLFLHLFLSPLIFQRGLIEVFEYPKATFLTAVAILLLAVFCSHQVGRRFHGVHDEKDERKKQKKGIRRGEIGGVTHGLSEPIPLGMILFLISAFLSTLFSRSGITSFYGEHENFSGLITITSYTILFFGTWRLCREFTAFRALLLATVLSISCITLYGLVQAAGLDPFTWKRTASIGNFTRIFGTLGHPNHLATFLVMGFPIVCYFRLLAWRQHWFLPTFILMTIESASAILVVFSYSRGAWAAMGVMFMVFLFGLSKINEKKSTLMTVILPWIIGLILGVLTFPTLPETSVADSPESLTTSSILSTQPDDVTTPAVGTSTVAATMPTEGERSSPPSGINALWLRVKQMGVSDLIEGTRWPIWTAAFAMFLDHPLFGVGLDGFRLAFQPYRPPIYWLREWGGTPTHAHNELLHILATQGLFGAVAIIVLTAGIGISFLKILRRNEMPDRILPVAIFSGIIGFYITNLFSFTVIGTGTLFVTLAGILTGMSEAPMSRRSPTGETNKPLPTDKLLAEGNPSGRGSLAGAGPLAVAGPLAGVWIVFGIVLYVVVVVPLRANQLISHTIFDRALSPLVARERLEKGVQYDAHHPLYFYHLGMAYKKEARAVSDPASRAASFKLAKNALDQAINLVPVDAENYIKLANLLLIMVRESPPLASSDEVYQAIQKALELDPYNADYLLIGSDIATALGDTRRASRWALKSIQHYPHFAPPYAQLGFISLIEAVRLAKDQNHAEIKKLAEKAIDHLERSLPLFWANHTDKKKTAQDNLERAYDFKKKAGERLAERAETRQIGETAQLPPRGTIEK